MGYDSMNIVEWFEQLLLFGLHVPLIKNCVAWTMGTCWVTLVRVE